MALEARAALAGVRRGRVEQVGVRVQLADQRQPGAVAATEPRDLVGSVARIPGEHEGAAREPDQEQAQQRTYDPRRGAVRPPAGAVVLGRPVQVDEHRHRPRAGGEREFDEYGEDDPLVAVTPGGAAVGRADGVPGPGLATHLRPLVTIDGVVSDLTHRPVGAEAVESSASSGRSRVRDRTTGRETGRAGSQCGARGRGGVGCEAGWPRCAGRLSTPRRLPGPRTAGASGWWT